MKKLLFGLILFPLLAVPVLAEETNTTAVSVTNVASPIPAPVRKLERVESREELREEFRTKVATIKDEKKKQILEHVSDQINQLNARATTLMLNHLARLEEILNKVKARKPEVDITAAQAKIDEAKTAATAQAKNEYIIEFTNENGLRIGASTAKTKFRADLKAVRAKVLAARQAVVDVLKAAEL